jgi:hypothetical protein
MGIKSNLPVKRLSYLVRITTFLKSDLKNSFIDDCIHRDKDESKVAKEIFRIHYEIIKAKPELKGKEFNDILKILLK